MNLKVCDNTVLNIRDSYAIDVRKAHRVGRRRNSAIRKVNVGIVIRNNTYDGRLRLYARKNDPDSYIGENVRISR